MESLGKILISLLAETKISLEADRWYEAETKADRWYETETKADLEGRRTSGKAVSVKERRDNADRKRLNSFGVKNLMRMLSEDDTWQAKQAKRKREKEDIVNNNPSFDPIFMKI